MGTKCKFCLLYHIVNKAIDLRGVVLISFSIILFSIHTSVLATNYYVSTSGNDGNSGTESYPFKTLTKGVSKLVSGDILYVRGGTYSERISVDNSGTSSSPIIITSYPGENPVIDGQGTLPNADNVAMINLAGNYINISNFEVKNISTDGLHTGTMAICLRGTHNTVTNMLVHDCWSFGILARGDYSTVEYCTVYNACLENSLNPGQQDWGTGISACRDLVDGHTDYATLRHNLVHDNWGEGISCFETYNTTIEDNISYNNWSVNLYISDSKYALAQRNLIYRTKDLPKGSQVGIYMSDEKFKPASSDNVVINNMVYGGNRNLLCAKLDNVLVAHNTFMNSTYSACIQIVDAEHVNSSFVNNIVIQEDGLPVVSGLSANAGLIRSNNSWNKSPVSSANGSGDIIGDPKIAKLGSIKPGELMPAYFQLQSNSPVISKAKLLDIVKNDYFNDPRDANPDMGADEYNSTANSSPVLDDIPNQTISEGTTFNTISLNNYVNDPDNIDSEISWSYSGNSNLSVSINSSTQTAAINLNNSEWNGSETITFKATDPGGLYATKQVLFTVNGVNDAPTVSQIPNQTINEGSAFSTINLNNYVDDVDNSDQSIIWTYSGNENLSVNINSSTQYATINLNNLEWNGSETITFKATDPGGLYATKQVLFTVNGVNDAPTVSQIPNQTINEGSAFATINLNNYVDDADNSDQSIIWTYSGNENLSVNINSSTQNAAINLNNSEWNGSETITFKATDPGGLYATKQVLFTVNGVNDAPTVSQIPNQTINEGSAFATINLNNYVDDADNSDQSIVWTYSGNENLSVNINSSTKIATISFVDPKWNGSETISFTATDPAGLYSSCQSVFIITGYNNPPEIENQLFSLNEEEFISENFAKVEASAVEEDQSLKYQIINGNESNLFLINSQTGELSVTDDNLFKYSAREYNLTVIVTDNGALPKTSEAIITLKMFDKISTIYIDPDNQSDIAQDGSITHPYSSWQKVIWKSGKSYLQKRGTMSIEDKITIGAGNIAIGAYGAGNQPEIKSNSSEFAVQAIEKPDISFSNIHIKAENAMGCIYLLGVSDQCIIEKCTLEGALNGARIVDAKTVTFIYNTLINCNEAIYSVADSNKIYYNIFKNNQTAIHLNSYSTNSELYNNVFDNNLVGLSATYSDLTLYNNIFYLNKTGDIAFDVKGENLNSDNNIYYPDQNGFLVVSNTIYNSLAEYQRNSGLDQNSLNKDPEFIDASLNNYDIAATSPAINTGKDIFLSTDFYGNQVPYGISTDIGLSESKISDVNTQTGNINEEAQRNALSKLIVYPNPSNGNFTVNLKGLNQGSSTLSIVDMAGKIIFERTFDSDNSEFLQHIDIPNLLNGIYNVILRMENNIYNQRIMIN